MSTLTLVREPGHVFETDGDGQYWFSETSDDRLRSIAVNLALAEFCCVLPRLPAAEPGRYPVFTVAASEPQCEPGPLGGDRGGKHSDPGSRCPSIQPGGVVLRVEYEPGKALFHFGTNAATRCPGLQWASLGPARPESYTERVLRVCVLIAPNGLYPSIEDAPTDQEELFGELALARPSRLWPWGCHSGIWSVVVGSENRRDIEQKSFPAGFGLSDVRVVLIDTSDDVFETMPYSGALDHLASQSWVASDEGDPDFGGEESVSRLLLDLAGDLAALSGGVSAWARRAESLAEEAQDLAPQLPENPSVEPREESAPNDL